MFDTDLALFSSFLHITLNTGKTIKGSPLSGQMSPMPSEEQALLVKPLHPPLGVAGSSLSSSPAVETEVNRGTNIVLLGARPTMQWNV